MLPRGCIIEDTNVRVDHLIISDKEECWDENGSVQVLLRFSCLSRHCVEMLLSQVNQLLMINVSRTDDHDILSEVVGSMEVNYHVSLNLIDVVDVSQDGLAHHMFSIDVIVDVLHKGLHHVFVRGFQFLPDRILFHLEVVIIVVGVAKHISKDLHRLRDVLLE